MNSLFVIIVLLIDWFIVVQRSVSLKKNTIMKANFKNQTFN